MKNKLIILTGADLTIQDVYDVAYDPTATVDIAKKALEEITRSRNFLEKEFDKKIIYGVNTGFGPMASHIIGRSEIMELQENLIHGHSVGMGEPLPEAYVLAAMVVRLNTLVRGYSGASSELLQQLKLFINKRIIPMVPEHGAVGTSGDLVQLAHIALALIGEGEVFYKGKRQQAANVLRALKIKPYTLKPKEGLSLINGTSMMAGIASLECVEARRLISLSIQNGAFALESVGAFDDSISEKLHSLRPHHGQQATARALRTLLASSKLLHRRSKLQKDFGITDTTHKIPESVQEVYSLRCISQVVGPVIDTLAKTWKEIEIEINSVTDNPIIDVKAGVFLHGGNFHGDYVAAGIDQLKMVLVKLTMLSERRVNFFLNHAVNNFFPPFMNLKTPGLTMGLQGLQFVATSTTSRSQTLAFPQYVHSIPTNADNQDIVSMGTDATLIASQVIDNAYIVLAIELITLGQATDFLGGKNEYSVSSRTLYGELRKIFPAVVEDKSIAAKLNQVLQYVKQREVLDIEWK